MRIALIKDRTIQNVILWEGPKLPEFPGFTVSDITNRKDLGVGSKVYSAQSIDAETLEKLRSKVNVERDRRIGNLVVVVNDIPFDGDPAARENIMGVLVMIQDGATVLTWRCADNVSRQVTVDQLRIVAAQIVIQIQKLYQLSWHLKDVVLPTFTDHQAASVDLSSDAYWTTP